MGIPYALQNAWDGDFRFTTGHAFLQVWKNVYVCFATTVFVMDGTRMTDDVIQLIRDGVAAVDPRIRPHVETADEELVASFGRLKGFTSRARHRFLIARELNVHEAHTMMMHRAEWARSTLPIPMSDSVKK
jgi:hypothetical protein